MSQKAKHRSRLVASWSPCVTYYMYGYRFFFLPSEILCKLWTLEWPGSMNLKPHCLFKLSLEYIFYSYQQNKDTEVLEKGIEFCVVFSCFQRDKEFQCFLMIMTLHAADACGSRGSLPASSVQYLSMRSKVTALCFSSFSVCSDQKVELIFSFVIFSLALPMYLIIKVSVFM